MTKGSWTSGTWMGVMVYVDDTFLVCQRRTDLEEWQAHVKSRFMMADVKPASFLLGIKVQQGLFGTRLDQALYVRNILQRFGMESSNDAPSPMADYVQVDNAADRFDDPTQYRAAVGALMFLAAGTRPDIAFAVHYAARFSQNPTQPHWQLVKRILRYLQGTQNCGILYKTGVEFKLDCHCDANWGGDRATGKSTTGVIFTVAGSPVTWYSRLQSTVAGSTAEAEYIALAEAARQATYLDTLTTEMNLPSQAMTVYCDNSAAVSIAMNEGSSRRSKHIDIGCHYVRERVKLQKIVLERVASAENLADFLTKPVGPQVLKRHVESLMSMVRHPARGSVGNSP